MEPKKTNFFKPLIPGFLTDFCIPKGFTLKHPDLTEPTGRRDLVAVLTDNRAGSANAPGKAWRVLLDTDGRRFLDGWKEFADDHSLRVGDFLVFDHLGGLEFAVLVFDPISACARSFLSKGKPGGADFVPVPSCVPSLDLSTPNADTSPPTPACAPSSSTEKTVGVDPGGGEKSTPVDVFEPSDHPYFELTVKQYCFKWHAMLIPMQFARKNNLAKRWCDMVVIDRKGRRWPVHLRHRKTGKDQSYLASGWDEFAAANGLKIGDTTVFELLNSGTVPVMNFYKLS